MKRFVLLAICLFSASGWTVVGAEGFLPRPSERKSVVRPADGDYVVVVHGWALLRDTMLPTVKHLHEEGYHVVSVVYDARRESPDDIVQNRIAKALAEHCQDTKRKLHFVGHSMGCLMIRKFLEDARPVNLGEVVFLAPPNQGIDYVDKFEQRKWFRAIFGDTARQLGTKEGSLPQQLGPAVGYEPGIIMGQNVSIPLLSEMLPGPDDGVVSVESGKMEGMRELICVRCIHMNLPKVEIVIEQTVHFLRHGRFDQMAEEDVEKAKVRIGGKK